MFLGSVILSCQNFQKTDGTNEIREIFVGIILFWFAVPGYVCLLAITMTLMSMTFGDYVGDVVGL